ncbi:UvrABC system protein C [Geodia barretti]|uniref:UvrABC system protein C n=1 Tax=Geodia barretti TaxID=519541 RepID=A0AA35RXE5_GEOBA|nr:UvrABC system protein C [Geodia barretti]
MTITARELDHLPVLPGVYLLKGPDGEVLYIGKANSLRARVRSYFRPDRSQSLRTLELARRTAEVETIVAGSGAEALILEANLIKEYRPRFNIQLRDDKSYPHIKVTVAEPFPRVFVTRRLRQDGSRYFGPYTSVGLMRQSLEVVKRLYTVRSCRYQLPREAPARPCLDHHIGRCQAPCVGRQSQESYREMIEEILRVLGGETRAVRGRVEARMEAAADALDFEAAARHRNVLKGLDALSRRQRAYRLGGGDQDVIGLARDGELGTAVVLRIREGILLGRETRRLSSLSDEDDGTLLGAVASRFYLGSGREVLVPAEFEDRTVLESILILSRAAGRKVVFHRPQRGDKVRLIELANANARHTMEDRVTALEYAADRADEVLYDLQNRLGLKVVPRLMACLDVSHTQGTDVVASVVVFENGEPRKAGYRRRRIRGDWGNDDFRSMEEAVSRYAKRLVREEAPVPDLVLVDAASQALRLGVLHTDSVRVRLALCANARGCAVFLLGRAGPVRMGRADRSLHLLQRMRDEAHRFAISYNRQLRRRRTIQSELEQIPGIGKSRRQTLLARFGSVRGVRSTSQAEIARLPGFSDVLATRVLTYLGK